MTRGRVVLDLVAPQSPSYRGRGIARHGLAFAEALLSGHAELVSQVLVHPELPPAAGMEGLVATGKVATALERGVQGGIFHVTSPFEPEIPARDLWPRPASSQRMRLAVTVYDLIPDVFPDMYLQDPGLRRRWRCGRELIRAADHVFTLSESGRDDVVSMLGVPAVRVSVIGSGCDERFHPTADRDRARRDARSAIPGLGTRFLVCNGAIDPRKNLPRLVESFARLDEEVRRDLQLVIACRATDPERNHFLVMAEALGVGGQVLLPGFVSDDTLVALYQSAELAVFPSLYEGYGLPVIEAQACGALVVAGDNSSLREITPPMARFDATDVASMASVIARAVTDASFRGALRAAASGPVPTWADVADRAAEGYERLLARDERSGWLIPGWRRRPAVALVTARAARPTGAYLHDIRLAAALAEVAAVDLFAAGVTSEVSPSAARDDERTGDDPGRGSGALPLGAHRHLDRWRGGYDGTVVCIDDDESSSLPIALLTGSTCDLTVVVAHAASLGTAYSPADGSPPLAELEAMYPGVTATLPPGGGSGVPAGALMSRDPIHHATSYLVRSPFEADLARMEQGEAAPDRVALAPWACPPPAATPAAGDGDLVLLLEPHHQAAAVVALLAALRRVRPSTRLAVLGGRIDPEALVAAAGAAGLSDGITPGAWDGSEDALVTALQEGAVALAWAATATGVPPYSVAVALASGVPVVVTGPAGRPLDACADLVEAGPSGVAGVPAVSRSVAALLDDSDRRRSLRDAGLGFAAGHGFAPLAARILEAGGIAP